jgi:hypothetical protein
MAITRAQQAKQMLRKGGRTGFRVGSDEGDVSGREYDSSPRSVSSADRREQVSVARTQGKDAPTTAEISRNIGRGPTEIIGGQEFSVNPRNEREREEKNFARSLENDRKRRERRKRALQKQKLFKTITLRDKLMLDPTLRTLDDNLISVGEIDDQFATIGGVPIGFAGAFGKAFKVDPSTKYYDEDSVREIGSVLSKSKTGITKSQADTLGDIRDDIDMRDRILDPNDTVTQSEFDEYINRNKIEVPDNDRSEQDPCKGPNPPAYCFIGDKADETQEAAVTRNLAGLTPRIGGSIFNFDNMADGGIAGLDREAFLLGGIAKGLKKAVRGVKKIAKSKIGKAALLGALGYGLGGGTFFGKMLPGVTRGGQGFGGFGGLSSIFGNVGDIIGGTGLGDKFAKFAGNKIGMGILGASVLPLIFGKKQPKDELDLASYYAQNQLEPSQSIRGTGSEFDFYGGERMRVADGGDVEPVAKKTMPLIDMDGKEKDYRETGGFVDMGRMEKADDVPARLSKNEFVFTADAVRNAGEGDIDKGAEVMYNMMKNLEAGGEVSEESQGLEGAREMFQTSQRLEEVI